MIKVMPLDQVEWTKTKQNSQEIKKRAKKGYGFPEILNSETERLNEREK